MRPRSREINIFNLSMLDVIAGAMGAFLIVMVVLLPHYRKQSPTPSISPETFQHLEQQLDAAQKEAARARSEAQAARTQLADAESQNAALQRELQKTFLLIHIHWSTVGTDLDLHVVDPAGNEFYWEKRTVPGATGELSVDSIIGPGNEVFTDSQAKPGSYRIFVHFFNSHGGVTASAVNGAVLFREGTQRLPSLKLTLGQPQQLMAVLQLDTEGRVRLMPP